MYGELATTLHIFLAELIAFMGLGLGSRIGLAVPCWLWNGSAMREHGMRGSSRFGRVQSCRSARGRARRLDSGTYGYRQWDGLRADDEKGLYRTFCKKQTDPCEVCTKTIVMNKVERPDTTIKTYRTCLAADDRPNITLLLSSRQIV